MLHLMGSRMPAIHPAGVLCWVPSPDILVMEVVDLLDVAKDDVLFVEDPRGYFLHTTGHFPQVGL